MSIISSQSLRAVLALLIIFLGTFVLMSEFSSVWPAASLNLLKPGVAQPGVPLPVVSVLAIIGLTCAGLCALLIPEVVAEKPPSVTGDKANASDASQKTAQSLNTEELSASLDRILEVLGSHSELNETYSRSLEQAGRGLIEATSPEQLRLAIGFLVTENNKMRQQTQELQGDLRDSQERVAQLRTNLHHAELAGMRDALTSISNRRAFDAMIDQQVVQAPVRKQALSLIFADIDHFKKFNDEFGHQVGDEVIRLVASILRRNLKGRDFVARYGGEEFACILPQTGIEGAVSVAENLRKLINGVQFKSPYSDEMVGPISVSFGIAELKPNEGKRSFLKRADAKLYEAKNTGRNRVMS